MTLIMIMMMVIVTKKIERMDLMRRHMSMDRARSTNSYFLVMKRNLDLRIQKT